MTIPVCTSKRKTGAHIKSTLNPSKINNFSFTRAPKTKLEKCNDFVQQSFCVDEAKKW